jgi:hypothetical protein
MKIALKLSLMQLGALVYSFNAIAKIPVTDRNKKVARSILDKVVIKIKKKHVEEDYKATLFTQKKKITFTLEFYEAHYLEYYLIIVDDYAMNDYDKNVLRFIRNNLNQKLT